jgi:drug/metabolite transporter (DMT)-like permease
LLGERVGRHRWSAVALGLVGVLIITRPSGAIAHWSSLMPLVAAFCYANYQIATRLIGRTDDPLATLFYTSIGGAAVTSLAVPFDWIWPTVAQWLILVALGGLGALGHFLVITAFTRAPASVLAPMHYTVLIWATLFGYLVFGDLPDVWTLVGAAVIVASALYVYYRERKLRTCGGAKNP